jgi:hypothetical protein
MRDAGDRTLNGKGVENNGGFTHEAKPD